MSIDVRCGCGKSFQAKDEHAGLRAKCPGCKEIILIPTPGMPGARPLDTGVELGQPAHDFQQAQVLSEIRDLLASLTETLSSGHSHSAQETGERKQYKVLTQKDKWFSGKFDPDMLEQALNSYASQGWRLRGVATASIPGFGGAREEMVFVMER